MKLSEKLTKLKNSLSIDEAAYMYPILCMEKQGFIFKNCAKCNRIFGACSKSVTECADHSNQYVVDTFKTRPISFEQLIEDFKEFFCRPERNFQYRALMMGGVLNPFGIGITHNVSGINSYTPSHLRETDPLFHKANVDVQFCMRFTDKLEVTKRHYVGFNMGGQHIIEDKLSPFDVHWKNKALEDLMAFFTEYCGLKCEDILIHCDFWTDGEVVGNMGPCVEFFIGGTEIANQVYMQYAVDHESMYDLPFRVVDMGLGLQRLYKLSTGLTVEASLDLTKSQFDLCRAAAHMIHSGVTPSKTGLGYNLRWVMTQLRNNKTLDTCIEKCNTTFTKISPLLLQYGIDVEEVRLSFQRLLQYEYGFKRLQNGQYGF